jgi:hypothetical protein
MSLGYHTLFTAQPFGLQKNRAFKKEQKKRPCRFFWPVAARASTLEGTVVRATLLILLVVAELAWASEPSNVTLSIRSSTLSASAQKRWRQWLKAQLFDVAVISSSDCTGCWRLRLERKKKGLGVTLSTEQSQSVLLEQTLTAEGAALEFEVASVVRSRLIAFASAKRIAVAPERTEASTLKPVEAAAPPEEPPKAVVLRTQPESRVPPSPSAPTPDIVKASMPPPRPVSVPAPAVIEVAKPVNPPEPVTPTSAAEPTQAPVRPAVDAPAEVTAVQRASTTALVTNTYSVRAEVAYNVKRVSSAAALQSGLAASLDVRLWRGLYAGVRYGFVPSAALSLDTVRFGLTRHELLVGCGYDAFFSWFSLGGEIGIGGSSTRRQTTQGPTNATLTEPSSSLGFVTSMKGHVRLWIPKWPRIKLDLAPTVDLVFGEPRYVFKNAGNELAVATDRLQPRLDLGLSFDLF